MRAYARARTHAHVCVKTGIPVCIYECVQMGVCMYVHIEIGRHTICNIELQLSFLIDSPIP